MNKDDKMKCLADAKLMAMAGGYSEFMEWLNEVKVFESHYGFRLMSQDSKKYTKRQLLDIANQARDLCYVAHMDTSRILVRTQPTHVIETVYHLVVSFERNATHTTKKMDKDIIADEAQELGNQELADWLHTATIEHDYWVHSRNPADMYNWFPMPDTVRKQAKSMGLVPGTSYQGIKHNRRKKQPKMKA